MQKDLIIPGRERDIGGFKVTRSIPVAEKRAIGPFVFLDHMGPLKLANGQFLNVMPHPHIGLATVTYLFEGRILHRDSLDSTQIITPGDLNWMTAGRGIVHSERTPLEDRASNLNNKIHGVQIWVGLPKNLEECNPNFTHWSKESLPDFLFSGEKSIKVLLGNYHGCASPVPIFWPTLLLDCNFKGNEEYEFSFPEKEMGFFITSGNCEINGNKLSINDLFVTANTQRVYFKTKEDCRFIVIGGDPFPEKRYIWWNFVSSSKERIQKAAEEWKNNQFGEIPGESDLTPLPVNSPFPK